VARDAALEAASDSGAGGVSSRTSLPSSAEGTAHHTSIDDVAFMDDIINYLRPVGRFVLRRSMFLLLGAGIGYAYGYHHADAGEPSLYSRVQSLLGVDNVRDDHMRRQRAIEAIRQERMDSIEAQLPH
jgi:hypothetical protein